MGGQMGDKGNIVITMRDNRCRMSALCTVGKYLRVFRNRGGA